MPADGAFRGAHPLSLGGFSPMWISCAPDHSKRCGFQRWGCPRGWAVLPDRTWITAMAATRSPVYCNGEREPAIVQHAGSGVPVRARYRPTNPVASLCIRSVRVNAGSTPCAISSVDIHRRNPLAALWISTVSVGTRACRMPITVWISRPLRHSKPCAIEWW